eukprot:CAMPEP_0116836344 /NCGR_PEP_ID=MMETSP0418-20121206/8048_1 /TAXON_ID=1158023 /ORGANISM="Astrosyne radiata, Strain 13vi08-1A" /LENGTH=83 /DNA_ID=CAMNT_0004466111 /DNA_START=240 /DNA_END=491 /DNA_ORIENTATION=-
MTMTNLGNNKTKQPTVCSINSAFVIIFACIILECGLPADEWAQESTLLLILSNFSMLREISCVSRVPNEQRDKQMMWDIEPPG